MGFGFTVQCCVFLDVAMGAATMGREKKGELFAETGGNECRASRTELTRSSQLISGHGNS